MGTKTWKVFAKTSSWSDSDNWKEGEVPQDDDDIVIPSLPTDALFPEATEFQAGKLTVEGGMSGGPVTVQDQFSWSGGTLNAVVSIDSQANGTVEVTGAPGMGFGGRIINEGTLQVTGSGTLKMGGGATFENSGQLSVSDRLTFVHDYGAPPGFINKGGTLQLGDPVTALPGKIIEFRGGAFLVRLEGGTTIVGSILQFNEGSTIDLAAGKLQPGPFKGAIKVASGALLITSKTSTIPPEITLWLAGGIISGGEITQADIRLKIAGTLTMEDGPLRGRVHVVEKGTIVWPKPPHPDPGNGAPPEPKKEPRIEGCLTIENYLEIPDKSDLTLSGGGEILVAGTVAFLGEAAVHGGVITDVGHVIVASKQRQDPKAKTDTTVTLEGTRIDVTDTTTQQRPATNPWPLSTTTTRRGSLSVTDGTLAGAPTNGGSVIIATGTAHCVRKEASPQVTTVDMRVLRTGVLRGAGILASRIDEVDGRIEVVPPELGGSLTIDTLVLNDSTARVELAGQWDRTSAALTVTNRLDVRGTLALDHFGHNGDFTAIAYGQCFGRFQRYDLAYGPRLPCTYGDRALTITGTDPTDPVGFDKSIPPADRILQDLYDYTDLAYVAVYLAPNVPKGDPRDHGRLTRKWMAKTPLLLEQGWGLLPVYFGVASLGKPTTETLSKDTGTADAEDAVALAGEVPFESGVIYLDLEADGTPLQAGHTKELTAYLRAWFDRIAALGFTPGVYVPRPHADWVAGLHPGVILWVSGTQNAPSSPFDQDNNIVPADLRKLQVTAPVRAWQWYINRPSVGSYLDREGVLQTPGGTWDINAAETVSPQTPDPPLTMKRYQQVSAVNPTTTPWNAGSHTITVELLEKAPRPNGTRVFLSTNDGSVQLPAWVDIKAEHDTVTVQADVHVVKQETAVEVFAWTHRQTLALSSSTHVTVKPG